MTEAQIHLAPQQKVHMIYLNEDVGSGTATGGPSQIDVDVTFEWPPEAIAEVRGDFHLKILSSDTCAVQASFPGLLHDEIQDSDASYFVFLIGARPQFNITTHRGDRLVFSSTGPFGDPEKVTGYQLGISEPDQHPVSFLFEIVPG